MNVAFWSDCASGLRSNLGKIDGQEEALITQAGKLKANSSESGKEHDNKEGKRKEHKLKIVLLQMLYIQFIEF